MSDLMQSDAAYRDVAVSTALATYRASRLLVELLQPWIEPWLERVTSDVSVVGWRAQRGAVQLWGDHLTVLYCHAFLERDRPAITQFPDTVRPAEVGAALRHLGWILMRSDDVPEPFLQRAADLWDWRMEEVQAGRADIEELRGFGWWVQSGKFDPEWWLPRLVKVAIAPSFEPHGQLGEQLAAAAQTHPAETVEVLAILLGTRAEPYRRFGLIQHAPDVLAAALGSGHQRVEGVAQNLIDSLGRDGHLDIMELVNRRQAGR